MKITLENASALTAQLIVEMVQSDYEEKVKKVLKSYQAKANIPGFRPGKVPMGMIQKMYTQTVLVEEVNKLVSDALFNYIDEQKLDILGNPLPIEDFQNPIDWENQVDFSFRFEVGFAPKFEFDLSKVKISKYTLTADDKSIDEQVEHMCKRVGTEEKPAEVNQELFDKIYGPDVVHSEKEMRERIAKEMETMYQREAERKFYNDAVEATVEATDFELPDDFLKRWLVFSNREKELTLEQVENEYDQYRKMLKWQLIETKIVEANGIKVEREDIKKFYITNVIAQYFPQPHDEEMVARFETIADSMMQNQEEVKNIYEQVLNDRLKDVFVAKAKIKEEKTTLEDFILLLQGKASEKTTKAKTAVKKAADEPVAEKEPKKSKSTKAQTAELDFSEPEEGEKKPVKRTPKKKED